MAQLDKFIGALLARRGTDLWLVAGEPPAVVVEGERQHVTDKCPTPAQVRRLIAEVTPEPAREALRGPGQARFDYALAGGQSVSLEVTQWNEQPRVRVQLVGLGPSNAEAGGYLDSVLPPLPPEGALPPLPEQMPVLDAMPGGASLQEAAGGASMGQGPPIHRLFQSMVQRGASDLHLSSDEAPMLRVDGDIARLDGEPTLRGQELWRLLAPILPESNRAEFEAEDDTDFAYEVAGLARFRANVFRDRRGVGAVFRQIPAKILTADKLGLPKAVRDLCGLNKGLVLVTGPTGSGKSTTLCGLIDSVNRTRSGHIITIEDPIEFVHESRRCLVNQREVGPHTRSFKRALRAALREDPDVVLVGEMRDLETISIAIETAETGHLVFGTLHTTTAYSTIDRIIDQYPPDQQEQIRVMLSESLKGVVSQTLCKKIGGGRVAALEVLLVTPAVSNLIREGKTFQIPSIMQTKRNLGMRLLNDALVDLVEQRKVNAAEAIAKASDKPGLTQLLKARELIPA